MGDTQCRPYIVVDLCDIRHIIGSGAIALRKRELRRIVYRIAVPTRRRLLLAENKQRLDRQDAKSAVSKACCTYCYSELSSD